MESSHNLPQIRDCRPLCCQCFCPVGRLLARLSLRTLRISCSRGVPRAAAAAAASAWAPPPPPPPRARSVRLLSFFLDGGGGAAPLGAGSVDVNTCVSGTRVSAAQGLGEHKAREATSGRERDTDAWSTQRRKPANISGAHLEMSGAVGSLLAGGVAANDGAELLRALRQRGLLQRNLRVRGQPVGV